MSSMATYVILHTNMGDIKIRMHDDMPITTGNFVKLAKELDKKAAIMCWTSPPPASTPPM